MGTVSQRTSARVPGWEQQRSQMCLRGPESEGSLDSHHSRDPGKKQPGNAAGPA